MDLNEISGYMKRRHYLFSNGARECTKTRKSHTKALSAEWQLIEVREGITLQVHLYKVDIVVQSGGTSNVTENSSIILGATGGT